MILSRELLVTVVSQVRMVLLVPRLVLCKMAFLGTDSSSEQCKRNRNQLVSFVVVFFRVPLVTVVFLVLLGLKVL